MRRAVACLVALLMGVPTFAQERRLAPVEARVLGIDYVLTPLATTLRRRCGCVGAAFADRRVANSDRVHGPGIPLRHVEPDKLIRRELDREWLYLVMNGLLAFKPDAGPNDRLDAATLLVTGRGVGNLQGAAAIRAGVQLYTLAAEAGHQDAQADLGYLYMVGLGVSQNDAAAGYWYWQGALNGSRTAQLALGAMYAVGRGVPQNDAAAVYWFTEANQLRFVADAYACGFGVDQDLASARQLYEMLAAQGDADAQFQLGNMLAEACGAPLDDREAAKWYEAAAQSGHPEAQIALSRMARDGLGVPQDPLAAYHWAELAVLRLQPDDEAMNDALAARASAARVTTPRERESAIEMARALVKAAQDGDVHSQATRAVK